MSGFAGPHTPHSFSFTACSAMPRVPSDSPISRGTTMSLGVLHVPFEACPELETFPILNVAASRGSRKSTARQQPDWVMHHARIHFVVGSNSTDRLLTR
jgi:hypothetical protein